MNSIAPKPTKADVALKSALDDLAIFGGTPAFSEMLHVGRPNVGNRERFHERVSDILERKWLTNGGRYVEEFEAQISGLAGVEHCIAMCNGTVALEIAIRAAGLTGEVIVPSFTFVATAHALQWQEITPVFCDVDPRTHNLDPRRVEEMITPRTTGVIGVHVWGRPCAIDELEDVARRHNLKLLFDSAHAFGCSYKGRMIGGFGNAEIFSFHATKFLNSLEGGAVVTNDPEMARKVRLMRNFGFTGYDATEYIGTNGKLDEVSAAMGLTNLESMEEFVAVNRRNYQHYRHELAGIDGIELIDYNDKERGNFQYIVIELDQERTIIDREQLMEILHEENVLARRYFRGCHLMEPYSSLFPHARMLLPETEDLSQRVMTLPTGTDVSPDQISVLCEIIRTAVVNGADASERLAGRERLAAPGAKFYSHDARDHDTDHVK